MWRVKVGEIQFLKFKEGKKAVVNHLFWGSIGECEVGERGMEKKGASFI